MTDLSMCPSTCPPEFAPGDLVGCVNTSPGLDTDYRTAEGWLRLQAIYTVQATHLACLMCGMRSVEVVGVESPCRGGFDTRRFRLISRPDLALVEEQLEEGPALPPKPVLA